MKLLSPAILSLLFIFLSQQGHAESCTDIFKRAQDYNEKQMAHIKTLIPNDEVQNTKKPMDQIEKVQDEKKISAKTPVTFIVFMPFLDTLVN